MNPNKQFHGSDVEKIEEYYGISPKNITSFSANVNPLGISYRLREELKMHVDAITTYPDREYTSLRKAIAAYVQTDDQNILVGNGSTELISLVMNTLHPQESLIVAPTYSEYEHEIALSGGRFQYFQLEETRNFIIEEEKLCKALPPEIDLLVLCNPNNPTSSQITSDTMRHILDCCRQQNIFVLVDETYVEFTEEPSKITSTALTAYYENLIVLRGISKFFSAPGLRLGYAVSGNQKLLLEMNRIKNPWTINSLAAAAGEIMFYDTKYIQETKKLISAERKRICACLDAHSSAIKYYPPHANFILLRIMQEQVSGSDIWEALLRKGILIRDCSSFPFLDNHYIRFCFLKPEQNDALLSALLQELS